MNTAVVACSHQTLAVVPLFVISMH